jgi:hypothetical protein
VKLETGIHRIGAIVLISTLAAFAASPSRDKNDKSKPSGPVIVDSGAFGVFVRGQRVATETFSVQLQNTNSIIKSQFKEINASDSASQKSDLEMTSSGELIHYEWSQASGGSISVFPDNEFLKERITTSPSKPAAEQAFLLPTATPVLDNNFFIHREVLAWKYLAIAPCKDEKDHRRCEPADFGTLIPQDRTSMSVRMELIGKEKVTIRGAERELLRLNLHGESFDWALWVDESDHFKLIRVAIPADNTEVVRD